MELVLCYMYNTDVKYTHIYDVDKLMLTYMSNLYMHMTWKFYSTFTVISFEYQLLLLFYIFH